MGPIKKGWKNYLLIIATLLLTLILAACSTAPATSTTSSPAISTTQPALPPTSATPTQTATQTTPTPSPSPSPTPTTTTPSPSPSPTPEAPPPTVPIYGSTAAPFKPSGIQADLYQYMLGLINQDRQAAGLNPVTLNFNAAAHIHAKDMLDNNYQAAHWGTDGLKPYMRYTVAGGLNYDQENSAYYSSSNTLNVKQKLQELENQMMTNDAASNWSHKDNILNKWHKKVNLGIEYNNNTMALVQQFEGDYVEYTLPPTLKGNTLSLTGHFLQQGIKLNNISIAYDAPPQTLTTAQLNQDQYHHYSLGERLGIIFPPPPPGQLYSSLPANSIVATRGSFDYNGWFYIQTDISPILSKGPGVYTVVLVALAGNEPTNMTNYSLFVK